MISSNNRGAMAYANVGVQTQGRAAHDPYQLVVLMFDSILENVAVARRALQERDLQRRHKAVGKAMEVLQVGLRASLDLERGGELAANLAALYDYCVLRLVQANAKSDEAMFAEVAELLKPVAQGWGEMRPEQAGAVKELQSEGLGAELSIAAEVRADAPVRRLNSIYGGAMPTQGRVAVRV